MPPPGYLAVDERLHPVPFRWLRIRVGTTVDISLMSEGRAGPVGALVARWDGEEFFVALPGADAAAGVAFADELLLVRAERDRCRGQTKRGARPDQAWSQARPGLVLRRRGLFTLLEVTGRPLCEGGDGVRGGRGRSRVGLLKLAVDLFAVDGHVSWCGDAQTDGVAVDLQHRDDDVVTDDEALLRTSAEHEHVRSFLLLPGLVPP
jgi:hypothetical protein